MKSNLKLITILFFTFIGIQSATAETILTNIYAIISDEFSDSIPEGICVVKGKVYEGYTEMAVTGGYIGEVSQTRHTVTDENGTYSLSLNDTDSTLYFFHPDYGEIVCWNYNFKSQHIVTIDFITGYQAMDVFPVAEKPVIYLYSDTPITASISLAPKGEFSFTYPQYDNGWTVNVNNNGLLEVDNQSYPYLFWEGKMSELNFVRDHSQLEGYCINTDSTIQFLENVLNQLGLNSTEKTDFITYWGPRLANHNYATIQFFVDDSYESNIATVSVSPKPDSQRRVYMLFQGSEVQVPSSYLREPLLKSFMRKGFTLIEWGGSELSPLEVNW